MEQIETDLSLFSLTKLMVKIQIILMLSEEMDIKDKILTLTIKQKQTNEMQPLQETRTYCGKMFHKISDLQISK